MPQVQRPRGRRPRQRASTRAPRRLNPVYRKILSDLADHPDHRLTISELILGCESVVTGAYRVEVGLENGVVKALKQGMRQGRLDLEPMHANGDLYGLNTLVTLLDPDRPIVGGNYNDARRREVKRSEIHDVVRRFHSVVPMDVHAYAELKDSMRRRGWDTARPAIVDRDTGEVVDGAGRLRVAQELGIEPRIVARKFRNDGERLRLMLDETLARKDIDRAAVLSYLHDQHGWSWEAVAEFFGMSKDAARRRVHHPSSVRNGEHDLDRVDHRRSVDHEQVLHLIDQGLTMREVAEKVGCSVGIVSKVKKARLARKATADAMRQTGLQ